MFDLSCGIFEGEAEAALGRLGWLISSGWMPSGCSFARYYSY